MAMNPEEYAARELNVPGYEEPVYAPGTDPNILAMMNGGDETPTPVVQPDLAAMIHEYNVTLPLELRRAELANEQSKRAHLAARTNFWNYLSVAVFLIPVLSFIAVLVK